MEWKLEEIISCHDEEILVLNNPNYFIIEEERVGKKYRVDFNPDDTSDYDVFTNNEKLTYIKNLGIRFGDYAEFLINYEDNIFQQLTDIDQLSMYNFKIGNVSVELGSLSLLFDLASKCFDGDKYYDIGSCYSISLKGITADNYEEYLVKALFLLKYYNEAICGWNPKCDRFYGYYDALEMPDEDIDTLIKERRSSLHDFESMSFKDIKHYEAISFFNEAISMQGHEISFHYFYKVIEYFFLICREDAFKTYINDYNVKQDIGRFIKEVTDIYQQKEDVQLENLLKSIESDIKPIVKDANAKGIISIDSISEFSKELYLHRNTIVHGKSDQRFKIKLPTVVVTADELFWNNAVYKIAEILIKKYCLVQ